MGYSFSFRCSRKYLCGNIISISTSHKNRGNAIGSTPLRFHPIPDRVFVYSAVGFGVFMHVFLFDEEGSTAIRECRGGIDTPGLSLFRGAGCRGVARAVSDCMLARSKNILKPCFHRSSAQIVKRHKRRHFRIAAR